MSRCGNTLQQRNVLHPANLIRTFGKNIDDNFRILNHLELFNSFNLPVMVGISRKSMIYKRLGVNPEQSLNGTSILNTVSLTKKVKILRVHDVKEAKECIDLFNKQKFYKDLFNTKSNKTTIVLISLDEEIIKSANRNS